MAVPTSLAAALEQDPGLRLLEARPVSGPINVDGRLDEPAWETADVATDFVQTQPSTGEPSSRRTEVRVLYGPSALYIGAHLFDDPENVRAPLSRRNSAGEADLFRVYIDGNATGRTAYIFGVTAAGVQLDAVEEVGVVDYSWDAVWESTVRRTDDGWVVEMAIPYSMLRFPRSQQQSWWIQFERIISRTGERTFWQPVSPEDELMGFIAGRLTGIQGISPRANIQVRPYTVTRLHREPSFEVQGAFDSGTDLDFGADIKVGFGSNLIFDATINPDFGQVEADPEVLNLTTFETFFPERRPFFLEGTSIFDYTFSPDGAPLLYTRRIGTLGRIVGAGKLTGRTTTGLSYGLLAAATSDGFEDPDTFTGEDFEPDLLYGALRLKQEFGQRSFVGAGLTIYDGFGGDFIWDHYRSVVGGVDWDIRLDEGTYRLDGALGASERSFSPELGLRTQHGYSLYARADKLRGRLTGGLTLMVHSDGFEPNDVGYFRENDIVRTRAAAQWLLNRGRPFGPFRLAFVGGLADQTWAYSSGTNLGLAGRWYSWWHFRDYQRLVVRGNVLGLGGYDVRESRGLGPVKNLMGKSFIVEYSTDTRRDLVMQPRVGGALFAEGGTAWNADLGINWSATDRLWLSVLTRYDQRDNVRAWVANEALRRSSDGYELGAVANRWPQQQSSYVPLGIPASELDALLSSIDPLWTDQAGAHYFASIFGARDQRSWDTSFRANYTLRANLSLQLYTQLFVARFQFEDFQLLDEDGGLQPLGGYPRARAENRRSLNTNAVLRWEYRPGSTVFVVWSHGRLGLDGGYYFSDGNTPSPFDQGTFRLALDTFDVQPTNIFLIKLNYLLMR